MFLRPRSGQIIGAPARPDVSRAEHDRREKAKAKLTLALALVALLLIGSIFLICSLHLRHSDKNAVFFPDFLRDLGIAFIVACIVAGLIELYLFLDHQAHSMREIIDIYMGDRISSAVWTELKSLIEAKPVIRQGVLLRLELDRISETMIKLALEQYYELNGLAKEPSQVTIGHELDYQFQEPQLDLPCFVRFSITPPTGTGESWEGDRIKSICREGRLLQQVWLTGRDGPPTKVKLSRIELSPAPGSYNLYTPDFIKGLEVVVVRKPDDIEIEVWIRPQGEGQELRRNGEMWSTQQLILPGQGIEIKFLQCQRQPKAPEPAIQTAEQQPQGTASVMSDL